ncbi:MAG: 3-hydroxyacyl-CoA dehydrogenase NAD-binding domain-containing protein [Nitrospirales bacterium]
MIFASNTSSISITKLGAMPGRATQVAGMHFMNPVPVMKLVELIRGLQTSDETISLLAGLADRTAGENRGGIKILQVLLSIAFLCRWSMKPSLP